MLEIGSGSGQHAVFFAEHLPHLIWQPTDTREFLDALRANMRDYAPDNVEAPLELDVSMAVWPVADVDHVFTANTLHIMAAEAGRALIEGAGRVIEGGGYFFIYGAFKYAGRSTTESNARFDQWLRAGNPAAGLRDFEWVDELAAGAGFELVADHALPANNQLLVYRKVA